MKGRTTLAILIFPLGAVIDFVLGYINGHSVGTGVAYVVFGLPVTALFYFFLRARLKANDESQGGDGEKNDPDDPNWPARWVP